AASALAMHMKGFQQQDFDVWRIAARLVLHGENPYRGIQDPLGRPSFFYPLTTPLLFIPATWLPTTIAGPMFVGASCGLLAYVLTQYAWWPLLTFLSGSIYLSVVAGQLSPLLTAAMVIPQLAWLGAVKPNIGLVILAHRPSWRVALIMAALIAVTIPIMPSWPKEWLSIAAQSPYHFSAWRAPGGFLLLTSILRWRRPEARLLAALAIVPSSPIAYEALPLFLIPRTRYQLALLVLLSDVALLMVAGLSSQLETASYFGTARWSLTWLVYMPALAMVLSRPNEGDVPEWLERRIARAPQWLRGRPLPV
ncbi:MAG TPA: hypothetical protein VLN59_12290, partial [Burkholderiales bacterium]|nr:hypothetical protein [Burkholderiales bacterium]